jgi:hypothetical protein
VKRLQLPEFELYFASTPPSAQQTTEKIMKSASRGTILLVALLLVACKRVEDRLYEEAAAKETAEGLPAAVYLYQAIVNEHPASESARNARVKLMEYHLLRQQEALRQLDAAEGKSEEEALTIYRRIIDQYSDTEVAKTAADRVARIEAARRAVMFSENEYQQVSQGMAEAQEAVGESLLSGTHPTGTYHYTDDPSVSISSDRKQVNTEFAVHWEGVSGAQYRTVYSIIWSKSNSYLLVNRLDVTHDDAVFTIDPQFLRELERRLTQQFGSRPILNQ